MENDEELGEYMGQAIDFCTDKGFSREDTIAICLVLCFNEDAAKEFLETCKDYTDFFDCLETAVKIHEKYGDEEYEGEYEEGVKY